MKSLSTVSAVGLAAVFCVVLSVSSSPAHTRARTTRGFKNVALSTARGFGKRGGLQTDHRGLQLELMEPGNDPGKELFGRILNERPETESFPADWFAEELAGNSDLARLVTSRLAEELYGNIDLARLVTSRLVDRNQDGELTAEELLRPSY